MLKKFRANVLKGEFHEFFTGLTGEPSFENFWLSGSRGLRPCPEINRWPPCSLATVLVGDSDR